VDGAAEYEQLVIEVSTDGTIDPEEGVGTSERPGPGTIEKEEDEAEEQGEVTGGEEGDVNAGNWDPRYGSGGNTD
jgi:hypothetical protein